MMKKPFVSLILASFLGAVVALGGYHFFVQQPVFQTVAQKQDYYLSNFSSDSSMAAKVPEGLNFIYAAKAVTPAVVHIKTYYKVAEGTGSNEEIFKYFFGISASDLARIHEFAFVVITEKQRAKPFASAVRFGKTSNDHFLLFFGLDLEPVF